MYYKIKI